MEGREDIIFVTQCIIWASILIPCFLFGIDYWRSKKKTVIVSISNFYVTKGWFAAKKILAETDLGRIVIPSSIYESRNESRIKVVRTKCVYYEGPITGSWYSTEFTIARKK